VRLLFLPHPLRADYSVPVLSPVSPTSAAGLASILLLGAAIAVAVAVACWSLRHTEDASRLATAVGFGVLLLAWLPVSSLGPAPGSLLAERYLVVPSWGWALGVCGLFSVWMGRLFAAPAGLAAAALALITALRVPVWHSDEQLFSPQAEPEPPSYRVAYFRGLQQFVAGDDTEARRWFTVCLEAASTFSRCHEGQARAWLRQGHLDEALSAARLAVEHEPPFAGLRARYRVLLAEIFWERGSTDEALALLGRAEKLDRLSATASRRRGDLLFSLERIVPAQAAYREAVRRDPGDPVPRFNLAICLIRDQRPAEAETVLRDLVGLPDAPAAAYYHLAIVAQATERLSEAIDYFQRFLAAAGSADDADMVEDARRRLQRLEAAESQSAGSGA
jgi:tetratricopeptide (TPR) repeat protein